MSRKVVDLSSWNGSSVKDWKQIKESVDGVILRVGYRGYSSSGKLVTDTKFKAFADKCVEYSIPFGVYWFGQEINEAESVAAANYVAKLIKNYKLNYPVFYDVEYSSATNQTGRADNLTKKVRTNCVVAFCEEIKKLGYVAGVYSTQWWFKNKMVYDQVKGYKIWCANWNKDDGNVGKAPTMAYDIWQYTSKGTIPGITKKVDLNLDESSYIEDKVETPKKEEVHHTVKKSMNEIVQEVIDGRWGIGIARRNALTNAGYDYSEVQKRVNHKLKPLSLDEIAKEVIDGKWGLGVARKNMLTSYGYDYAKVQARVNEMYAEMKK